MVRSIGMLLIIWGLITQPLMAALTEPMTDNSSLSVVANVDVAGHAMGHHGDPNVDDSSITPCHDSVAAEGPTEPCDNCGNDCADVNCATSCAMSGAVAVQKPLVNIDRLVSVLASVFPEVRAYGTPSRIFHPPKQA